MSDEIFEDKRTEAIKEQQFMELLNFRDLTIEMPLPGISQTQQRAIDLMSELIKNNPEISGREWLMALWCQGDLFLNE